MALQAVRFFSHIKKHSSLVRTHVFTVAGMTASSASILVAASLRNTLLVITCPNLAEI